MNFPPIVLGLWRLVDWQMTPAQRLSFLQQALELGVSTIDQADIYGDYQSDACLGEAFALQPSLRDRLQIVTKCGIKLVSANRPAHRLQHYDTSREHIIASVENSLRAMRIDAIDLLLIHRPDPLMQADELAKTFQELQQAGKVKNFGASNFTISQFELLTSRFPLVTNQIEFSLRHLAPLHDGTLDQCQRLRIAPMIWSALSGGKLFSGTDDRSVRVRGVLGEIAAKHGVSMTTIAIAWILQHPATPAVLTGSGRIAVIEETVAATKIKLSREEWFDLWCAAMGKGVD
jgi:predicted oxidoreductase